MHTVNYLPNEEISVQCNFSLLGGKSTGLYRFKTGFYGLTTMSAVFQRAMDCIVSEFLQAHAFIDNFLVVIKVTEIDNIRRVKKIKKKWKKIMALKPTKRRFAQRECEWLGHKINTSKKSISVCKLKFIESLKPPCTLSQLKSFMVLIQILHKVLTTRRNFRTPTTIFE